MGKGGSKTQTVTNETRLPQWVDQAGQANYQMAQQISSRPYQPYTGNMLAGWNQGQQSGYNAVMNGAGVGLPAQSHAQGAALSAVQAGPQMVQGAGYNPAMQGVMNTDAASAGNATPWTVMNTHAANAGPAAQMAAASAGHASQMQAAQMGRGDVRNVAAQSFPGANLDAYMNPYISSVVNSTLGQLGRQNDIIQNQSNAKASAAGAFGGGRQAVMNAENNRAFLDTAGQVTSNLYNQGFNQAQNAIQTDQNRALQADLANQSADWNVGQANLANRQNAGLQNMLAGNNMAQFNAGNVQAANLQNMGALNNMAQYNASNQQQASRDTSAAHNSAAASQAANANQMAQYNASNQQSAYNQTAQAHNAALANQAAAANRALEFGADADLRAQQANQSAWQNNINSRISGANALNSMGMDEQTRALRAAEAQYAMGQNRTAFDQAGLTNAYNQWAAERDYPLQQLNTLQSGLTQTPYGNTSNQVSPYYQNTGANMLSGAMGGALLGNTLGGGLMGYTGIGGGVGAALGLLCWVARAAYGADNPRWLEFREWMVREAPVPLYRAYLRHGPAVAAYIADKPKLRRVVRGVMDGILRAAGR